jgi:hypothetical protein
VGARGGDGGDAIALNPALGCGGALGAGRGAGAAGRGGGGAALTVLTSSGLLSPEDICS